MRMPEYRIGLLFSTSGPYAALGRSALDGALLALDEVNGDLSDGQAKFRDALSKLSFDTPTGKVSLDKNRQAIADIYLTEVTKGEDGHLYNAVVKVVPQVNQTLGIPEDEFLALGKVGRDNPSCP